MILKPCVLYSVEILGRLKLYCDWQPLVALALVFCSEILQVVCAQWFKCYSSNRSVLIF